MRPGLTFAEHKRVAAELRAGSEGLTSTLLTVSRALGVTHSLTGKVRRLIAREQELRSQLDDIAAEQFPGPEFFEVGYFNSRPGEPS